MKHLLRQIVAVFMAANLIATPVLAQEARAPVAPATMEVCGLHSVNPPWCDEALPANTAQLQAAQLVIIPIADSHERDEWLKANRDKRGIGYTVTNPEGQMEMTGRSAVKAVFRAYLYPPTGSEGEPMLFPAVAAADGSSVTILLPSRGDYRGWTAYVLSPRGDWGLTLSGQVYKIRGGDRKHGRLLTRIPREMTSSIITETISVRRGDGSGVIEALEATFTDRVMFADGRHFSGLPGTFTALDQHGSSIAVNFTREDTVGDRMVSCGNLRIDPVTGVVTGGISLIPQGVSLLITALRSRC